jgi:hypothetical protein
MSVDFAATASDYAQHRPGFLIRSSRGLPPSGSAVRGRASSISGRARATSRALRGARLPGRRHRSAAALVEQARRLDEAAGVAVDYRVARAEKTGLVTRPPTW